MVGHTVRVILALAALILPGGFAVLAIVGLVRAYRQRQRGAIRAPAPSFPRRLAAY